MGWGDNDNGLKNAILLGLPFAFTFLSLNQAYNCRIFFPVSFPFPRIDGVYQPDTEGIFQPAPTFALEDCLPIVATIDYVVNQAVGDGS